MADDVLTNGGGAGGGAGAPGPGNLTESINGAYGIRANQVDILARPPIPPAIPTESVVTIVAAGLGMDGRVVIRGSQGVRVTAGPPPLPEADSSSTNGVEMVVGETGNLTLQRGIIPEVDQKMEMTPTGVTIDGGV